MWGALALLTSVACTQATWAQQAAFDRGVLGNIATQRSYGAKGSVKTTLSRNYALVAEISLGTPTQWINCLLDTGSSDLWVPSRRCTNCQSQHLFSADGSSTFSPELRGQRPVPVSISYGSGEIVGYAVRDTLGLGDVSIEEQSFVIVEEAHLPRARSWDGICGLGWEGIAKLSRPLYKRIQEQGLPAVFAFMPGRPGEQPSLRVGSPEEDKMRPNTLTWVQAETMSAGFGATQERGFWLVRGGLAITREEPVPARFLVDTGTNQVLLAPPRVYDAFMRSLLPDASFDRLCGTDPAQGNMVVCDCSISEGHLPPLRLYLGGHAFVLQIKDLFRRVSAHDGSQLCLLQIQPNGLPVSSGATPLSDILGGLLAGMGAGGGDQGTSQTGPDDSPGGGGDELGGILDSLFGPSVHEQRRLQFSDPMEDVWMIGGVFLEHFVTVFDFDHARIGFAEPAGGVHALTTLSEVLPGSVAGALEDPMAGGPPYLGLLCAVSVAALGVLLRGRAARRQVEKEEDGAQLIDSPEASEVDVGLAAAV